MAVFSADEVIAATGARAVKPGPARFDGVSTDSRSIEPGCLFVALRGEKFDAHTFLADVAQLGAAGAVVEAGHPRPETPGAFALFEVESTLAALGGLGRSLRRRFPIPLGAVTGSNGKTTTKEMIAAILTTRGDVLATQGNLNNEIGVPLTLLRLESRHRSAVIEMGMNHPGEIDRMVRIAEPDAGLVTVIQAAHLEGLGSIEGVAQAKGEMFRALRADGLAVVNLDDRRVVEQARASGRRMLTFGTAPEADVQLSAIDSHDEHGLAFRITVKGREYPVRVPHVGQHNAMNACAAFAMGVALGFAPEACVAGLARAPVHSRRLELKRTPAGIVVIDDCYNANPSSMKAALETLAKLASTGRAIAVLGDMLELGPTEEQEHRGVGESAAASASLMAFFGERARWAAEAARNRGGAERVFHSIDVDEILEWLRAAIRPGDRILVKGSRGMRMERIVAGLVGEAPASPGH
jgi:UDP-N-acetylmuramoyl-tripeptide--D-alanyl-D-alanine ligase